MGEDMPIIPFGGHPNWYQYNTKYWVGFSNKVDNPILPAGPFGGSGYSGLLQTAVLNLRPAGAEGTVFGISLAWIAAIVIVVVVVIVVLAVVLVRRRSSKK
jgi:hypothetical protein